MFIYSRNLKRDEQEKHENSQGNLSMKCYRFLAYGAFINLVLSTEYKRVRYVLPSCVVSTVRAKFPDPDGVYTGHVVIDSDQSLQLP